MDHHSTSKTSLILFISLSSLLFLATATRNIHIGRPDIHSDITEFCKKTTNPAVCAQTIQPHFLKNNLDPLKALDVEVDATLASAKKTLIDIQTLESKKGITKSIKDSFDTCKDQYGSMLDAIKETKAAIAKKDIITAKFKFSAVLSYQGACKDAFESGKIPFSEDSDAVYNLGGNCLDIIADMEKAAGPQKMPPVQQTPSAFSNVIGTIN
ncbi:hypothetical protein AAZX31_15G122600 [Glycine max]|uniref:Pectinesterase inhibitor domain-containing protein n=2 Tax=Glycine subgen. Soja TaxID=1462606 RepID=I1MG16_SOYBN|nr:pectinesterase inhibitor 4 [Glycine max]XP_028201623.1 pectinesterase inhibitor 4-like [Glycine soja]KAG4946105.1 hypothetical protein JHK87_042112 [Glycine soja]KAG4948962.1 hypothetical protein JHK86_042201 [Glycine max]KAG4956443.1 hypothetical protein JHK85_042823 [Glycine max]KAG5105185.1 hypothetical protein JHK82_042155 [Glycine max]KAG5116305.1 hypothetical protein JHK84_042418 [Glycine max]|eukprot:XP_003546245.1 pectinesterase inhibitor 4 [Glycine max]